MHNRRSITIVALVWTLIIVAGFVANGLSLKASGYPSNPGWVSFNRVAEFMRLYGGWFIVLPPIWTYFAGRALGDERHSPAFPLLIYTGVILAFITAVLFIYGTVIPYTKQERTSNGYYIM